MDIIDMQNETLNKKQEIKSLAVQLINTTVSKTAVKKYINENTDEIDFFINSNKEVREELLVSRDKYDKALLLNGCITVLEKTEKLCGIFIKLAYQIVDVKKENLFNKTDILCFSLSIM